MIARKEGMEHGDTMAIKSLLPHPYTFIYSQDYIKIGDIIMAKVKRVCEQCGREFEVKASYASKAHFCSRKCMGKAQSKTRRGEKSSTWKGGKIKRICRTCGKEFEVYPSVIRKGVGIFCSQSCSSKAYLKKRKGENHPNWKGGEINLKCPECGKIFEIVPSRVKKGRVNYCSRSCLSKATIKIQRNKKIPTKPELIFDAICKRNNLPFYFVGNKKLWIGKKGKKELNPDFTEVNGKKILVEVFGDYWHSPLLNRKLREDATLQYRKKHFKHYKWHPIFIWATDLLRKDAEPFVLNELKKEGII